MHSYRDTWGQVSWWAGRDNDLIHPDDLDSMCKFSPVGTVFHCLDEDAEYITIKYGDDIFRIKPELYKPLPVSLQFEVGDWVKLRNEESKCGIIYALGWHWKNHEENYFIRINGTRKSTRRYREVELQRIDPPITN